MRCPTLSELPPPPPGKTGWPWTQESPQLSEKISNGSQWPRISIVTPSYNQGQFIEETIRSVLLQGYPNLEHIIIDGGSTDNSVEIIKKYEHWLTYWVSEPDKGQTDAIQKGFNLSSGVVWNWLNSDDLLEPNALQTIGKAYLNNPSATIYAGDLTVFGRGEPYLHNKCFTKLSELVCLWENWNTPQQSIFLASNRVREVHGLNISIRYAMDYELYLRLAQTSDFQTYDLDAPIARFRLHSLSKTLSQSVNFKQEIYKIFDEFAQKNISCMPQGWRKSRRICNYHLSFDLAQNHSQQKLPFNSFLNISLPFIFDIWNYRFFWSYLLSYFRPTQQEKVG